MAGVADVAPRTSSLPAFNLHNQSHPVLTPQQSSLLDLDGSQTNMIVIDGLNVADSEQLVNKRVSVVMVENPLRKERSQNPMPQPKDEAT